MKRLLALLLAILMLFSLVACGNSDTKSGSNTEKSVEELVKDDDSTIGKLVRTWCETISIADQARGYANRAENNFYKYTYTCEEKTDGEEIKRIYKSENNRYKFTVEYDKTQNTLTITDVRTAQKDINNGYKTNTTVVQFNSDNILVGATKTNEEKSTDDYSYDQIIYSFDELGNLVDRKSRNSFNNKENYKFHYEYDDNNNLIKLIYDDDYNEYTYDENGNITIYSYTTDEYGKISEPKIVKVEKLENGNKKRTEFDIEDKERVLRWEIYDHYGNAIERTDYKEDGTMYFSTKSKYNEEGDCIKETRIDEYGESVTEYKYDENGEKIDEQTTYPD